MLFSIIVPAYNAEGYIAETVMRALVPDAPYEYEIIVVNDGSTDTTEKELIKLSREHGEVKFKTVRNGGPASARNVGLSMATGEYVLFCDADDCFKKGAVPTIMDKVRETGCDFFIFGFDITDGEGFHERYFYGDADFSNEDFSLHAHELYSKNMLNQVWGKVFRRSIIEENGIRFLNTRWGEDRLFVFDYVSKCKKISVTGECYYDYYQTAGSLILSYAPDKFERCLDIDEKVRSLSSPEVFDEARQIYDYMFIKSVISSFTMLFTDKCPFSRKEKRAFIEKALLEERVISEKKYTPDCGLPFKFLAGVIKTGNVTLIMIFMRMVHFASEHFKGLFRHSKHKLNRQDEKKG